MTPALPIQSLPPVLTTEEAAAVLRCEPSTVERYVHRHELQAIQIGRKRRIRGNDLLQFINDRPATTRTASGPRGRNS